MTADDQKLVEQCSQTLRTLEQADTWVRDNTRLVGSAGEALLRESNRLARSLRKEAVTAARKMCVGVFGPSQAGKSYLISTLAQDADGALLAHFGADSPDFLKDINPAGDKESTGLVTRFTLTPSEAPEGRPVRLRLLSELDLVRIFVNTYYADCQHLNPPDEADFTARLDQLAALAPAGTAWQASFSEDDMLDLHDYVFSHFRATAVVQLLERVFWPRAVALAGRLPLADRARLFEMLWDDARPFTGLYTRLTEILDQLGHPDVVFCGQEALLPRETSIIDVETLKSLGEASEDCLEVVAANGRSLRISRAETTALTAELSITMRHKPDDFFDHTDLLDFPGYRSRLKTNDVASQLKMPDQLRQFFLRGKVAYLFERYKLDFELTGMLLCIGPSNQEVQDLPAVINDWITDTHGQTPELRAGRRSALFLVLTKFDMQFDKKTGAIDDEMRWSNRLHASLLDFFGKQYEWPLHWTPTQAFNNTFWLRNPKYRWEAVIEFNGERESALRPGQLDYLASMKQKFLATPEVLRHFADPEAAWDAAFTLNDGGVSYLKTNLRPVCEPAIKRRQVSARVRDALTPFVERLRRFHRVDDKEVLREQQRQLGLRLARSLAVAVQNQRFGDLLHAMTVRDHELYALYYRIEAKLMQERSRSQASVTVGSAASAQDIMNDLFGDELPAEAETAAPQENLPVDEADVFAELVLGEWVERLHALAEDPVMQQWYGLSAADFGQFVHELIKGAGRLELSRKMAEAIRMVSTYRNLRRDRLIWRQASMAAASVNSFVSWLGFNPLLVQEYDRVVRIGGRDRTLFRSRPPLSGYPEIPATPQAFDRDYSTDWIAALVHLVEANVNFEDGQNFDPEQNARLGSIARQLDPASFAGQDSIA